ncbi:MAG: hypothetical protein K0S80_2920 [Neobacillus sp.]|nr:hypothetical protein [Neobacillus sp.]
MIPHSDSFRTTLKSQIKELYIKIELYNQNMDFIKSIEKKVAKSESGSISVDKGRPVRRNFNFTLNNVNGEFTWGENSIIWLGTRVKVWTGLKSKSGIIEYIPQGVFVITEPQDTHTQDGKMVTISGQDLAFNYTEKRGKFVNDVIISEGINIGDAIKLIAQENGETRFLFDAITETVPYELTFSSNSDRWKAMEDLSRLAKCEIFFDVNGYLRVKKLDDLNDIQNEAAVWTFTLGDNFYAGNVRKMDESQMYNHFITIGGGSNSEVFRHEIIITEADPLWADSPYSIEKIGRIIYFHNDGNADSLIDSLESAKYRNKYELMQKLGYAEKLSVTSAPVFVLDASDIIEVTDSHNNVSGRYMIDSLTIPLKAQPITFEMSKEVKVVTDWNLL